MKTADLIPLVLRELYEGDKYGFELTKSIETKSNGHIVIKQPTLYTLLKKLEKSKFISSYWEDSEIGGKRHYYKLTQNGKLQVSTLPPYEDLIFHALNDYESEEEVEKNTSPLAPQESVLPTNEVFTEKGIDSATEMQLNSTNVEILKPSDNVADINFASNENVMKFSKKIVYNTPLEIKVDESKTITVTNFNEFKAPNHGKTEDVKYVDFVDFKHSKEYKQSKLTFKKLLFSSLIVCITIVAMSLLCLLITRWTGRSALFFIFLISAFTIAIFYPILVGINGEKLQKSFQNKNYKPNTKLKLCISILIVALTLIACIVVNLLIGNNSIVDIFKWTNFANIYGPLMISCTCFADAISTHFLTNNVKK